MSPDNEDVERIFEEAVTLFEVVWGPSVPYSEEDAYRRFFETAHDAKEFCRRFWATEKPFVFRPREYDPTPTGVVHLLNQFGPFEYDPEQEIPF